MEDGILIAVLSIDDTDYISFNKRFQAKDGDFFISDWFRNRNAGESLDVWKQIHSQHFNYGGFAILRSQAGLNSYILKTSNYDLQEHV